MTRLVIVVAIVFSASCKGKNPVGASSSVTAAASSNVLTCEKFCAKHMDCIARGYENTPQYKEAKNECLYSCPGLSDADRKCRFPLLCVGTQEERERDYLKPCPAAQ